jgi:phenylacetaldehyde dehydrogenase
MNIAVSSIKGHEPTQNFLAAKRKLLIGGKWVDAQSGKTFPVYNPADGQVIARVAEGDKADVDLAVKSARAAFESGPWPKMAPNARAKLLWKLADALEANADEFALIETLDNGKPLKMSRLVDVAGSADRIRYYAGWATKLSGQTVDLSIPGQWHAFTLREPIGVAGLIVPWNFPLMMAANKMAPALAAGCTVILKPAEQTPLTALRLGELMLEVGFPEGVVNIITGFGETAGAAITEHPGVDKVSFTGSTEVGKLILKAATGNLKRVTLELGGKSPTIVFPDVDIDAAVAGAARGIFFNSGQVCAAGSRLFAHKKVFDQIVEGISKNAQKLKIGSGIEPDTDIGPLVSQEQLERVTGYLNAGAKAGAKVVTGGGKLEREGYFVQPTILTGTTADMAVRREEIFGPVLCAMTFDDDDLDKIAAQANDTSYGLAATIWTRDLSTAHKMVRKIKAGSVRVNGGGLDSALPFGGYKQSGWGRENGREGIESFTEIKSVAIGI